MARDYARSAFSKKGERVVRALAGKIVRHRDGDPRNNDVGNLTVEPTLAVPLLRYMAVRAGDAMQLDWFDLSTLSDSAGSARRLADRVDERNRKAIRNGTARAHLRVARVEIREVR